MPPTSGASRSLLWLSISENDRSTAEPSSFWTTTAAECNGSAAVLSFPPMIGFWLRCIADLHPPVE